MKLNETGSNEEITYKGQISWTKSQCGAAKALYGSDLKTDTPIELTISRSKSEWNLSKCYFERGHDIISVSMTPLQWAEFLTSGNNYGGVPCTITKIDRQPVEQPKQAEELIANFEMDAETNFDKFTSLLNGFADTLQSQLDKGSFSKKEMQKLIANIRNEAKRQPENIQYLKDSFNSAMQSVVVKAKAEINSYVEQKMTETGYEMLKNKMLFNSKEEN